MEWPIIESGLREWLRCGGPSGGYVEPMSAEGQQERDPEVMVLAADAEQMRVQARLPGRYAAPGGQWRLDPAADMTRAVFAHSVPRNQRRQMPIAAEPLPFDHLAKWPSPLGEAVFSTEYPVSPSSPLRPSGLNRRGRTHLSTIGHFADLTKRAGQEHSEVSREGNAPREPRCASAPAAQLRPCGGVSHREAV